MSDPRNERTRQSDAAVQVINAPSSFFGDLYHALLRAPWWLTLLSIAALFLATNTAFALGYVVAGGIANARDGSFADAFFFSVQTLGTIGYGAMYPVSRAANVLVTAESIAALLVTALSTGLVFAKFSVPTARLDFSRRATVSHMDGEPTLAFRIANVRGNYVVEAQVRVVLVRREPTREGVAMYRMRDLTLVRDRSPALGRSWTVLHKIAPESPLYGATTASLTADESELIVTVVGIDGTSNQTIHARHVYDCEKDLEFGARPADLLTPLGGGRLQLDLSKFHETEPAPPQ